MTHAQRDNARTNQCEETAVVAVYCSSNKVETWRRWGKTNSQMQPSECIDPANN